MGTQPWTSEPREILQHGLSLLRDDSDSNRRLAMLSIDNAVELIIKTYLGLPKRVIDIHISRKKFAEISESFPEMLDALEEHADQHLEGIDLGEIEWFHRLRNQLYHQGNGLTVAREQAEVYAELAKLLYGNLFGEELPVVYEYQDEHQLLGEFIAAWVEFEKLVAALSHNNMDMLAITKGRPRPPILAVNELIKLKVFSEQDAQTIHYTRKLRNEVVHGVNDFHDAITPKLIKDLRNIIDKYSE